MASVFISYSRKDQLFVHRLFDALKAAGRDAWVDWEGIPPIAEWMKEVYDAIDAADTFVLILSPDSVSSAVCGEEAAHAVANKKRIIPLVVREVRAEDMKRDTPLAPLVALNWIFMRENDDFDKSFGQLCFALDTDLAYWHLSSRLLVRANEWKSGKKNANLSLRGPVLRQAEHWLAEGVTKIPPPGPPVTDFIAASLKQRRRSRLLTIALVLVILLSGVAGTEFFLNASLVTTLADDGPGSLRQNLANASPGSIINFAPWLSGTIQISGNLPITKQITVHGPGAQRLSIGSTLKHDFTVTVTAGVSVMISGLTFKSGITNSGKLTLTNSLVSGNTTNNSGTISSGLGSGYISGGITNTSTGTLLLVNSMVKGNTAVGGGGGGIDNWDGGTIELANSSVIDNATLDGNGGGIENEFRGRLTLIKSRVSGNLATSPGEDTGGEDGGGIENDGLMTLTDSMVSGNITGSSGSKTSDSGGGIGNSGTLTLTDSSVSDNIATGNGSSGGGIANLLLATLTLSSSTVSGNKTIGVNSAGGGIYNEGGSGGQVTLTNSTISNNTAQGGGGGGIESAFYATGDTTPLTMSIIFCTLYGNQAATGGAIASDEFDENNNEVPAKHIIVAMGNSLVAGNQNATGPAITGFLTTDGYNLLQDVTGTTFLDPDRMHGTDILLGRSADLSHFIDPTLRNNPGPNGKPAPTQTLALIPAPGNPAIAVIPLAACHIVDPATNKPLLTDQRGMPRPDDHEPFCDIGAYESSG